MRNKHPIGIITIALSALFAGCTATPSQLTEANANIAKIPSPQTEQAQAEIQREAIGQGLYELAYSPKQKAVFVAAAGGRGEHAQAPKILRVDPISLKVQAEIILDKGGFGVVLDDEANRLYVGHARDGSISVIDTQNNQVIKTITVTDKIKNEQGQEVARYGLRELVLDKANHRLYAPGHGYPHQSVLFVIDTQTDTLIKTVPDVGYIATGIALDTQGKRIFLSEFKGQIYVVDTDSLEVVEHYDSGSDQPLNLAFDAQTNRLFATDQGAPYFQKQRKELDPSYIARPGHRVVVINPDTHEVLASLPTSQTPILPLLDTERARLYVTARDGGSLDVFDSNTYEKLTSIDLPDHPNSLALDAQSGAVFVTIKNGKGAAKGSLESIARIQFQ